LFLADRRSGVAGSAVVAAIDGHRPLLVEVQALVTGSQLPAPRRSAQGIDPGRLAMLLAVLQERAGWPFSGADVYVSASQPLVEAVRTVRPEGVDAVLDTARLGQAVIGAVADGGRFVTTRLDALPQAERGIRVLLTQVGPDGAMLSTLSDLAAAGDLALRVAETYPLEEVAKAYAHMIRGGFQGRVVLTME
jgi:hypothetical protein